MGRGDDHAEVVHVDDAGGQPPWDGGTFDEAEVGAAGAHLVAVSVELPTASVTVVSGRLCRKATSQTGSRYSAMVKLAATCNCPSRSVRGAATLVWKVWAAALPVHIHGQRVVAVGIWVLAAALFVALGIAWARQLIHGRSCRKHLLDPVMAQFHGAPPMAALTVGAGALLLGRDLLGQRLALDLDVALWTIGTVGGLATAVLVPYLMFTRHQLTPADTFAGWLMPVVPPM